MIKSSIFDISYELYQRDMEIFGHFTIADKIMLNMNYYLLAVINLIVRPLNLIVWFCLK